MATCLIGLGSNLGDRAVTLDRALELLRRSSQVYVKAISGWHRSRPAGAAAGQNEFLNGAAQLETALAPQDLLALLLRIEAQLGRRRSGRWAPRVVDLDLLLYDDVNLQTPVLVLPHPRMAYRRFVLEPAAEIAPDMIHPTTGWSIRRLLEHLNTAVDYVAIAGPIGAGKTELAQAVIQRAPAIWIAEPVDDAQLARFYSDPASLAWDMELELLDRRRQLLSQRPATRRGDADRQVSISDFWLDQSVVFARLWLSGSQLEQFEAKWRLARGSVVQPKLLVLLDAPSQFLAKRIAQRGRAYESVLTVEWLEQLRRQLLGQASLPNQGPMLKLDAVDPAWAVEEVTAAIQAMQ